MGQARKVPGCAVGGPLDALPQIGALRAGLVPGLPWGCLGGLLESPAALTTLSSCCAEQLLFVPHSLARGCLNTVLGSLGLLGVAEVGVRGEKWRRKEEAAELWAKSKRGLAAGLGSGGGGLPGEPGPFTD